MAIVKLPPGQRGTAAIRKENVMMLSGNDVRHGDETENLAERTLYNVAHGRFERSLSGLTAMAALVTTAEIYFEHFKASFGNKWMWSPIVVTPPVVVAGIGGVFSRRWANSGCRSPPASIRPMASWASTCTPAASPANRAGGSTRSTTCPWVPPSRRPD